MRRYAFYFSIALLAFGIGSLVSISFYLEAEENLKIVQSPQENKTAVLPKEAQENQNFSKEMNEEKVKTQLTCQDKTLRLFWLELKEKVVSTYGDEQSRDCADFFSVEKKYDLNNDGSKEIFVKSRGTAFCGVVGNCQLFVFSRKANLYKSILYSDMSQTFRIKNNKSKGFFDVESKSHGSATSGGIVIYKFDGHQYKMNDCFAYEYETIGMKNGQKIFKDEPDLTPKSCLTWLSVSSKN